MDDTTVKISSTPLAKIALSCSGGGYRAASFHLGTMSYLNHLQYQGKPLLANVKMLSTVSGGTITGIVYALLSQQGKTFDEIYDFMLDRLKKLDLLKLAIEKLNPDAQWNNPHKRKNLINAFAELYDEHFTGRATFSELDEMQCHLEAVAFNSTEFDNAVDFRFRNRGTGFFGNYYLRVSNAQAGEIRLADAMAASSCFPGGFEPILWPGDFIHQAAPNLQAISDQPPVGIMDGGIYDNQGIDTILKYKHNAETPYFDCIIVSDVSSPHMTPYQPPPEKPKKGFNAITLGQFYRYGKNINRLINLLLPGFAVILGCLPFSWGYGNSTGTGICITLAAALLVIWFIKLWLVKKALRLPVRLKEFILAKNPQMNFFMEKFAALKIGDLSIHRARPLLLDRLYSLLSLLSNVFLLVVRRLNYNMIYNDDHYRYRRIGNLIRRLTKTDYESHIPHDNYDTVVGPNIQAVAETAANFGTTLWFTPKDELDDTLGKLVATGQFTMCFNMIEYLDGLITDTDNGFTSLPADVQHDLWQLYAQCKADWKVFMQNPLFLLKPAPTV